MCVVSMVGDHYRDHWTLPPIVPPTSPFTQPTTPYKPLVPGLEKPVPPPSWDAFLKLQAEVEELKRLLKRAKAYDERNGEPDCEIDEKMDLLRKVAKMVGIDLDDVIAKKAS